MSRLRLPLRLARREVLRRPGRTALVALLVALPVAGMSIVTTLIRTDQPTRAEEWALEAGTADARVYGELDPLRAGGPGDRKVVRVGERTDDRTQVQLPPGSRTVEIRVGYTRVRTEAGDRSDLELTDAPFEDPMTRGILDLIEGRAPRAPGDVVLSAKAARRLGTAVGETLVLDRPALRLEVVGLVEDPRCLGCSSAVFAPGQLPDALVGTGPAQEVLVDLPALDAATLADLAARPEIELRSEYIDPSWPVDDQSEAVSVSLILGGVALTVMGIVISAAFAVGARRKLVTLGQLSASGSSPAAVRTMLVLEGTVTGLLGGLLGLVLAAGVLLVFHDGLERTLDHRFGSYELRPLDHLAALGVGVAAATIAALIPARTAARVPTLAALAGRRPQSPVPRRLVAAGVLGVAMGLGLLGLAVLGSASDQDGDLWGFVALLGGVCELLGACAIAPALVTRLEPLAGRLRGPWRIAARGLARQRTRTAAVVSAVAVAGALAIAATALVRGADQRHDDELDLAEDVVVVHELVEVLGPTRELASTTAELPSDDVRGRLEAILPAATPFEVRLAFPPRGSDGWISVERPSQEGPVGPGAFSFSFGDALGWATIADERVLDVMRLSDEGRRALTEDGAVVVARRPEPPGQLVVSGRTVGTIRVAVAEHAAGRGSELLVTEAFAREAGLDIRGAELVLDNPAPLTELQRDAVEDVFLDSDTGPRAPVVDGEPMRFLGVFWHEPSSGPSPFQLELILSGVALLFALFVVGASLALAAAESKDERDVLTVAGAPPRTLARAAGARAWLLAGIGALLALPIGFLPVVVFTRAEDDGFPLVFPATTVALLLLAVPTVLAVVAHATSATAQRLRPVRVSTATFE